MICSRGTVTDMHRYADPMQSIYVTMQNNGGKKPYIWIRHPGGAGQPHATKGDKNAKLEKNQSGGMRGEQHCLWPPHVKQFPFFL